MSSAKKDAPNQRPLIVTPYPFLSSSSAKSIMQMEKQNGDNTYSSLKPVGKLKLLECDPPSLDLALVLE